MAVYRLNTFMWCFDRPGPDRVRVLVYCAPIWSKSLQEHLAAHQIKCRQSATGTIRIDRPSAVGRFLHHVTDPARYPALFGALEAYERAWQFAKQRVEVTEETRAARIKTATELFNAAPVPPAAGRAARLAQDRA